MRPSSWLAGARALLLRRPVPTREQRGRQLRSEPAGSGVVSISSPDVNSMTSEVVPGLVELLGWGWADQSRRSRVASSRSRCPPGRPPDPLAAWPAAPRAPAPRWATPKAATPTKRPWPKPGTAPPGPGRAPPSRPAPKRAWTPSRAPRPPHQLPGRRRHLPHQHPREPVPDRGLPRIAPGPLDRVRQVICAWLPRVISGDHVAGAKSPSSSIPGLSARPERGTSHTAHLSARRVRARD